MVNPIISQSMQQTVELKKILIVHLYSLKCNLRLTLQMSFEGDRCAICRQNRRHRDPPEFCRASAKPWSIVRRIRPPVTFLY